MAGVDRINVLTAFKNLFEADTGNLYGRNNLISNISLNIVEFLAAWIDVKTPYKMFLSAPSKESSSVRMQNEDYIITINYRIEGRSNDEQTAYTRLDDIDERIEYLINNEMWGGTYLTNYLSVSNNSLINTEWQRSDCDIIQENDVLRVHCEGSFTVEINRLK